MLCNEHLNELGAIILDAAITVHKELGPGLLESVYQFAMMKELEIRGISARQKVRVPLFYKGYVTGKYFESDILVEEEIIIDIKAVENQLPVHKSQVLTYLKLADKKIGIPY